MGMGPMIGVPAAMRTAADVGRGRRITVSLEVDEKERTVEIPRDLARAMSAGERRVYDNLSYSHRKEYALWIEDAKKLETRARRIAKVRAKLKSLFAR